MSGRSAGATWMRMLGSWPTASRCAHWSRITVGLPTTLRRQLSSSTAMYRGPLAARKRRWRLMRARTRSSTSPTLTIRRANSACAYSGVWSSPGMAWIWYSYTARALASISALRSNQSGCSTSGYQSIRPHNRSSTPPVPSSSSHCLANVSCGTRVPASTRATCERSHGILFDNSSCVRPAASRKCLKTSPNTAALVAAGPLSALRRRRLTASPLVPEGECHASDVATRATGRNAEHTQRNGWV